MKKIFAGALLGFGLLALLGAGGAVSRVAADGGTETTLTGTSAVILKARDGRNYAAIIAQVGNAVNASCVLQTVAGTNPTAVATNIVLEPGKKLDLCTGVACFGGSVSCIAVSGSPIVQSIDF